MKHKCEPKLYFGTQVSKAQFQHEFMPVNFPRLMSRALYYQKPEMIRDFVAAIVEEHHIPGLVVTQRGIIGNQKSFNKALRILQNCIWYN